MKNFYQVMIIKNLLAHKNLWLAFAIIWTSIIFILCLIDSGDLPSIKLKVDGFDKVVHFSFHFIFTLLWIIYFYSSIQGNNKRKIRNVILSSFFFGVLIEILQGCFTTTRNADILDVVANSLGALTSGIVMYFILNRINKLKTQ